MKSVKQQKSTCTKTANLVPAKKPKKLGLATSTGIRAGVAVSGY